MTSENFALRASAAWRAAAAEAFLSLIALRPAFGMNAGNVEFEVCWCPFESISSARAIVTYPPIIADIKSSIDAMGPIVPTPCSPKWMKQCKGGDRKAGVLAPTISTFRLFRIAC